MPLMPERVKYRKMQRGHRTGIASRGATVAFGEYGLQSLERCWLDTKQIEAARVAINRYEAPRQGVDPGVSRSFLHQETARDPHGSRQGRGGVLGCGNQAG